MFNTFKPVKITDKVYWVGAIDWNIRDFHGYSTSRGTTYNAYLILSKKPVLIDTVKAPLFDEMMKRISEVIDPKKIDTIVSNHAEMDHSGSLPMAIEAIKPKKVIASKMGKQALAAHFHDRIKMEITAVNDGEKLDIGGDSLTFIESRMLHWPDSMICMLESKGILFSNDIFGMHLATSKRFNDEVSETGWLYEAQKYFANIVLPYSNIVTSFLKKAKEAGLSPKIIAPDHGPIWRKNPMQIVELYEKWAKQEPVNRAVVFYDTMWGSTEKIASSLSDGLMSNGTEVKVMPLNSKHRSDVMTEILSAGAVLVGSPVLNQNMFPTVADMTTYMRGLKPQNKIGNVFGSYGWSIGALENLQKTVKDMGVEMVGEPIFSQYVPSEEVLDKAFKLGVETSQKLKQ
jgi:flavorubredoxin